MILIINNRNSIGLSRKHTQAFSLYISYYSDHDLAEKSFEVLADYHHDNNADIENINNNALHDDKTMVAIMVVGGQPASIKALSFIFSI